MKRKGSCEDNLSFEKEGEKEDRRHKGGVALPVLQRKLSYDAIEESEEKEEWAKSECECGRCKAMNKFHDEWNDWNPTDQFQCSIKNAIDKTIDKYE